MQGLKAYKMKKLGILVVYLFGSEAYGTKTVMSDIDVGIVLKNPKNLEDIRPLYNAIYSELSKVFRPAFLRGLDIVFLQTAPITLQYNAITSGRILYEEDPVKRADYEEKVVNQYLDFKPVIEYFDSIASKRYA
jgi:predicted nucleotidyltransferase